MFQENLYLRATTENDNHMTVKHAVSLTPSKSYVKNNVLSTLRD
jgi:hypothetical protein